MISSWGIDLLSANLAVPVPKSSVAAARAVPNTPEVARPGALARWPNLDTIIRQPRSLRVEIYTAFYTRIAFRMASRGHEDGEACDGPACRPRKPLDRTAEPGEFTQ